MVERERWMHVQSFKRQMQLNLVMAEFWVLRERTVSSLNEFPHF